MAAPGWLTTVLHGPLGDAACWHRQFMGSVPGLTQEIWLVAMLVIVGTLTVQVTVAKPIKAVPVTPY